MEQQKKMTLKRRTTSTIPFGYKTSEQHEGFYEPVESELNALDETAQHVQNKALLMYFCEISLKDAKLNVICF